MSRVGLRPTPAPMQWMPGFFPRDGRGVNLTTHVYLLHRLRIDGANPLFSMPSWRGTRYRTPYGIPIWAQREDGGTSPTHSHPQRWKGVGDKGHVLAVLHPGRTGYPSCRRLAGLRDRSGGATKTSSPTEFHPRTVQPEANRYTN